MTHATTIDRTDTPRQRARFARVRRAETAFARALRRVAAQVGELVNGMTPEQLTQPGYVAAVLGDYAKVIKGWARSTSARMLADVSRRDEAAWAEHARGMTRELRREVRTAPVDAVLRTMADEQVVLITSLPTEAARRVHDLVLKGLEGGRRAEELAAEVRRTGKVTASRANLIARTEVARTASKLVEARATHVGSEGYIWRTARDLDVRESHRKMEGQFVRWDAPPTLIDGTTTHAGQIYNCRCYPEPVVPDVI